MYLVVHPSPHRLPPLLALAFALGRNFHPSRECSSAIFPIPPCLPSCSQEVLLLLGNRRRGRKKRRLASLLWFGAVFFACEKIFSPPPLFFWKYQDAQRSVKRAIAAKASPARPSPAKPSESWLRLLRSFVRALKTPPACFWKARMKGGNPAGCAYFSKKKGIMCALGERERGRERGRRRKKRGIGGENRFSLVLHTGNAWSKLT